MNKRDYSSLQNGYDRLKENMSQFITKYCDIDFEIKHYDTYYSYKSNGFFKRLLIDLKMNRYKKELSKILSYVTRLYLCVTNDMKSFPLNEVIKMSSMEDILKLSSDKRILGKNNEETYKNLKKITLLVRSKIKDFNVSIELIAYARKTIDSIYKQIKNLV